MRSLPHKLRLMAELAKHDSRKPLAGTMARHAISKVPRRAPLDANLLALSTWVREWIRYTHEQPETLSTLGALQRIPVGDCDDMAIALASLVWRLGYPWRRQRFAVGWKGLHPRHVWLEVLGAGARWVPLDPSTWRLEAGQDPRDTGLFSRTTTYNLRGLLR